MRFPWQRDREVELAYFAELAIWQKLFADQFLVTLQLAQATLAMIENPETIDDSMRREMTIMIMEMQNAVDEIAVLTETADV